MSSEPKVTSNKSGWHVPSKHSSAAPTQAPAKRRHWYHAYIITLWKYHGHKGRGTTTARLECGSTALGAPYTAVSFFIYILSGPNYLEGLSGNTLAEHTMQQPRRQQAKYLECPGGLYNELNVCFYLKTRSLPLEGGTCQIIPSLAYRTICIVLLL